MNNNQRKKYLFKNTAIFALGSMGTKLIAFFLVPIYTVVLSTSEFGTVDLMFTTVALIVPLLTLNIAESVMRFSLDKGADYEKILSTGIIALVLMLILGLLIFPISNCINQIIPYTTYLYFYMISLGVSQVFMCYLRGIEKLLQFSIGNIIQSFCIALFNILFLVFSNQGIEGYFRAFILANIITAIYAFFAGNIYDAIKKFKIDIDLSKKMIVYSAVLMPTTFMWWIMNSSDRIMVSAMVGVAANGIYSISYKIPSLLTSVTGIFTQAWSYSAIKEKDSGDIERYNNIIYDKLFAIVLIISVVLITFMKPILFIYVDFSYYEAWMYTPFLIVGFVFMTLASFVATSYTVHKDSKGFLISGIVGAVANIILNWILIPFIGVYGAAVATCISYFFTYLYRIIDTQKYLKLKPINKENFIGLILLIFSCIMIYIESALGLLQIIILVVVLFVYRSLINEIIVSIINKTRSILKRR